VLKLGEMVLGEMCLVAREEETERQVPYQWVSMSRKKANALLTKRGSWRRMRQPGLRIEKSEQL